MRAVLRIWIPLDQNDFCSDPDPSRSHSDPQHIYIQESIFFMQFAVWTTNTEADSHDSMIICSVDAMRHELIEATRWVASQLDVGRNWYIKFCEGDGKKKKNICYFCFFNGSTEADGHDGTECTSVLWTRCVIELIETTRFIASQLTGKKKFILSCKGVKRKIFRLLLLF